MLALGLLAFESAIARGINKGKLGCKKLVPVSTISISCRWHGGVDGDNTGGVFIDM
jgi:hypothetical protein